jgi:hypothetical protein
MRSVTRAQAGSEQTEPKTILGFLLGYFAVFAGAVVTVVGVLVWRGHVGAALGVLAAAFLASIAVPIWVARTHTRNPAALTLGQSTARDYLEIERWTAGDSAAGEYVVDAGQDEVVAGPKALPLSASTTTRPTAEAEETIGPELEQQQTPEPESGPAAGEHEREEE